MILIGIYVSIYRKKNRLLARKLMCLCNLFLDNHHRNMNEMWSEMSDGQREEYKEYFIGGFQLEFVFISRAINHMTCYKFECFHWLKLQHSDWRANLVKDFFEKINFPPMGALKFLTGNVTFKLCYNQN